ncbi:MAG TPA: AMIN domain-containing protein, partial [Burkholderiaceae bacterium]|nr:AMIN domain-containing protein [Burkholderiaceae bacterium]
MNRRHWLLQQGGVVALWWTAHHSAHGASIIAVRVWPAADYTRVTIESDEVLAAKHFMTTNPPRLVVDIDQLELSPTLRELVGKVKPDDPYIAGVRVGQNQPRLVRLVVDLKQAVAPQQFTLTPVAAYGHRLVFDLYPLQERDPLLEMVREKDSADRRAEQAVRDSLGELIGRVDTPPTTPRAPAPAPPAQAPAAPPDVDVRPSAQAVRKVERLTIVA